MTAPLIQSVQYAGTSLFVIFDRAIAATNGDEIDGFTATKTPGGVQVLVYVSITDNALIATLPEDVESDETLELAYVSGSGTIVDAATGMDAAPSFTVDAVPYYETPDAIRAIVGQGGNSKLDVYFNQPIASPGGDLKLGFTIQINDVVIDLTSATATLNTNATILMFDIGSSFSYNDVVAIAYEADVGDLVLFPFDATVAEVIADFSFDGIPNISTDGLPDSQYPLSWVTSYPVTVVDTVATGQLGVSLNPIDITLVAKYGPVILFTGGTFGITIGNPLGIEVLGRSVPVIDGLLVSQSFVYPGATVNAVDAAKDWQIKIIAKIAFLLGQVRAIDQGIVFNTQQVDPV